MIHPEHSTNSATASESKLYGPVEPFWNQRTLFIASSIFIISLGVRLLYLYETCNNPFFEPITIDAIGYHTVAQKYSGRLFSDFTDLPVRFYHQPFFYPFFLALIYKFTGSSLLCVKIIQAVIGATTCVTGFVLGRRLFTTPVGVVAGLMLSIYGPLIYYQMELLGESWAIFWAMVLVLLFYRAAQAPSIHLDCILGLCCGLASITRPTFFPFILLSAAWLAYRWFLLRRSWALPLSGLCAVTIGFAIIAIPVSYLNYQAAQHATIFPGSGGLNMYIGNNPDSEQTTLARPGPDYRFIANMPIRELFDDYQRRGIDTISYEAQDELFYQKVRDYLNQDPVGFIHGLWQKTCQYFSAREIPRSEDIYLYRQWSTVLSWSVWRAGSFGFPFGIAFPLAAIGIFYFRRRVPGPMILLLLAYSSAIILVHVCGRYRVPAVGPMLILSAAGVIALVEMIRNKKTAKCILLSSGALILVFLTCIPGPFPLERLRHDAELYTSLGEYQRNKDQIEEAAKNFSKALDRDPTNVRAHYNLGHCLITLDPKGNLNKGLRHLVKAIDLKPHYCEARLYYAGLLLHLNQRNAAAEQYRAVIRYEPASLQAREGLNRSSFMPYPGILR